VARPILRDGGAPAARGCCCCGGGGGARRLPPSWKIIGGALARRDWYVPYRTMLDAKRTVHLAFFNSLSHCQSCVLQFNARPAYTLAPRITNPRSLFNRPLSSKIRWDARGLSQQRRHHLQTDEVRMPSTMTALSSSSPPSPPSSNTNELVRSLLLVRPKNTWRGRARAFMTVTCRFGRNSHLAARAFGIFFIHFSSHCKRARRWRS
jgi:hypothetical protein